MGEKTGKAYKKVELARAKGRPTAKDYIDNLIIDFTEFAGDRLFGDGYRHGKGQNDKREG